MINNKGIIDLVGMPTEISLIFNIEQIKDFLIKRGYKIVIFEGLMKTTYQSEERVDIKAKTVLACKLGTKLDFTRIDEYPCKSMYIYRVFKDQLKLKLLGQDDN